MARSRMAGAVVLGSALALAACGGGSHQAGGSTGTTVPPVTATPSSSTSTTVAAPTEPQGHATDAFAVSYRRTISAGSAQVSMRIVSTYSNGLRLPLTASGAERWRGALARITLHVPPAVATSFGSSTIRERYVGSVLYLGLPKKAQALTQGRPWLGITGFRIGSNSSFGENPAQALELLEAQSSSVVRVGPATVGGVATTEYRATIDLPKATANAPAGLRSLLRSIEQHLTIKALPVTVYLDRRGRLREMVERETVQSPGASGVAAGPVHTEVVIKLSDYGAAVHVVAPPKSQTLLLPFSAFSKALAAG